MGELAEFYKDQKDESQRKRWDNYRRSRKLLLNSGIPFEEKDNGHFVVAGRFDFWATTGLFIDRQTKKRGRGVKNLIYRAGEYERR